MSKKTKKIISTSLLIFVVSLFSLVPQEGKAETQPSDPFTYEVMEGIPGFINPGESAGFNEYVSAIYKFGIWTVGIAALLMLSIGAFTYITSAGNNAAMGTAKTIITDSIIGLVLALLSWLLLYTINPDLVNNSGISKIPSIPPKIEPSLPPQEGEYSHAEAVAKLNEAGINVNHDCGGVDAKNCTSLNGIPKEAIDKVIRIKNETGINIILTGGTEKNGHGGTSGRTNHGPGNSVVDIQVPSQKDKLTMNNYLKNNTSSLGITKTCSSAGWNYKCSAVEPDRVYHLEM